MNVGLNGLFARFFLQLTGLQMFREGTSSDRNFATRRAREAPGRIVRFLFIVVSEPPQRLWTRSRPRHGSAPLTAITVPLHPPSIRPTWFPWSVASTASCTSSPSSRLEALLQQAAAAELSYAAFLDTLLGEEVQAKVASSSTACARHNDARVPILLFGTRSSRCTADCGSRAGLLPPAFVRLSMWTPYGRAHASCHTVVPDPTSRDGRPDDS